MKRRNNAAAVIGLVLAAHLAVQGVAAADEDVSWGGAQLGRGGDFDAAMARGREAVVVSATTSSRPSPYVWIGTPQFGSTGDLDDGNGGYCTERGWARVLREDAGAVQAQAEREYVASYERLGLDREGVSPNVACPVDPAEELPVAMVEEFITAAVREQLPRPTLSLPPGYAITGMRTFLVTEHELEFGPVEVPVDLGIVTFDVRLSASGASVVDWGDGTLTSHTTGGAGFPDGQITHVYVDEQSVDITVTDTWTVDYEAGPFAGTLSAPLEPVTLPAVEIQQRQAVRTH